MATASKKYNKLKGGMADSCSPEDFDSKQLEKGTKVEMEHTNDPSIAKEIAMDHLKEFPDYYIELAKMEKKLNKKSKK